MRWLLPVVVAGCGYTHGALGAGDDVAIDSGIDAVDGNNVVWPAGPFGTPVKIANVSDPTTRDDDVTLTADMLEMYFEADREVIGDGDIYRSVRPSVNDPWSLPSLIVELSTSDLETSMEISPDGLTLYFSSDRSPSQVVDIWVSKRADRLSPWGAPMRVTALNSTSSEWNAQPLSDTNLIFGSNRTGVMGGSDVFRVTRGTASDTWGAPEKIPGLDTSGFEGEAFEDASGAIWFTGNLAGTEGSYDLWRSLPNSDGTYKPAARVSELASMNEEADAWISPDGHTIYFTSNRDGTYDIFMATR